MTALTEYERALDDVFSLPDRYESHRRAIPILRAMEEDRRVLTHILRAHLERDDIFTQGQTGPVISCDLLIRRAYTSSLHCFFPLPDRATNISHNWIHHHDHSLLTSINVHGEEGYSSMLFNRSYQTDPETRRVRGLKIEKDFNHRFRNVEFVDSFVPHVVYIPASLTMTFALWSFDHPPKLDGLRASPLVQRVKRPLRAIAVRLGLAEALDLETETTNRQFAPDEDGLRCVGNLLYAPSTNAIYVRNLFFVLQEAGFADEAALAALRLRAVERGRGDIAAAVDSLLKGERFEAACDRAQLSTKGINFTRESVIEAIARG
jgi:hypothetical protein